MSTTDQIFQKARTLPEPAQAAVLLIVEQLALRYPAQDVAGPSLTHGETADLRGKLAAWEEDWNAPGMEAYDRN